MNKDRLLFYDASQLVLRRNSSFLYDHIAVYFIISMRSQGGVTGDLYLSLQAARRRRPM